MCFASRTVFMFAQSQALVLTYHDYSSLYGRLIQLINIQTNIDTIIAINLLDLYKLHWVIRHCMMPRVFCHRSYTGIPDNGLLVESTFECQLDSVSR